MNAESLYLKCIRICYLKDPSQHTPFLMLTELFMLHGEPKFYCFTVGNIVLLLKICLVIVSSFSLISFVSTCSD